ncbi:uncharacterized protein [Penaeus vannamei]|uniref:uncharacterized protein n=1 Tax=Penaeus vannamei TaxID=6689 RepID=UPI00387F433A
MGFWGLQAGHGGQLVQTNLSNLKTRATEFNLNIQNSYSLLSNEDHTIGQFNKQFNNLIKEAALEVGGKNKQSPNKLSVEKRRVMKVSSNRDTIELAELTKTIIKKKKKDVRKFSTQILNETVISGTSMKTAKRRLGIGRNERYAIRKPDGEVTYDKNEIIREVEDLQRSIQLK